MKGELTMKKFETPEVEVIQCEVEDVMTASSLPDTGDQGTEWT